MNEEHYYEIVRESEVSADRIALFKKCCKICQRYFPGGVLPSNFEVKWVRKTTREHYASSEEPFFKILTGLRKLYPDAGIDPEQDTHIFRNTGGEFSGIFQTRKKGGEIKMIIFLRIDQDSYWQLADTILHEFYHMIRFVKDGKGPCAIDIAGHLAHERGAEEFAKRHL